MSYLKTVTTSEATGDVADVYQEVTASFGWRTRHYAST
jgi:hypothetical protein